MSRNRARCENRQSSPTYNQLENRNLLAVNLQLTDAFLVDGNLNEISSPVHGERVGVRATWSTTDLPNNTAYKIGFFVDGVELQGGPSTAGSGLDSASGYWWYRTGWYADGDIQNVTVVVDVDNEVAEADESDNTLNFSFTSREPNLTQKFIWPTLEAPYSEIAISNYVDVDPSGGVLDYAGDDNSYNGHQAFDSGPGNFQYMDRGLELMAAADGVVNYVHDGEFDRQTSWIDGAVGNAVIIDHGEGWETIYWHFRKDSVRVAVGDVVSQGDILGYMGSSGISSGMHIHFGFRYNGRSVEPMFAESSYFENPFGNVYDSNYVFDSYLTNHMVGEHRKEGTSRVYTYPQEAGQRVTAYARFSGNESGDAIAFKWYRPNGQLWLTASGTQNTSHASSHWWFRRSLPDVPDLGTWRIDISVNDVLLKQEFFEVTPNGAPEMRIEDDQTFLIVDDRYTPIDFGTSFLRGPANEQSFSIINHGSDDLVLSNIRVPDNFEVRATPASVVAPGASETLTVALKTDVAGNHAGEVRISTNDSDEPIYNFSVEGFISSGGDQLILGVSERRTDEGNSLVANVRRPNTSGDLTVTLSSGDATEVSMPSTVTIPDGENYVSFFIQSLSDGTADGPQITTLSASATGHATATNTLEVLDIDANGPSNLIGYDDSTGQRSVIRSINVDFNIPVTIDSGAFELRNGNGHLVDVAFTAFDFAGATRATLTFSGSSVDSKGSLEDGHYELKIISGHVRDNAGNQLNGGVDSTDNFFRLFGDTSGNGLVNADDLLDFRKTYRLSTGDVGFNQAVDFNADGRINAVDLLPFRTRYGKRV